MFRRRKRQRGGYLTGTRRQRGTTSKRQKGGYLKGSKRQRGGAAVLNKKITDKVLREIAKGTKLVAKMGKTQLNNSTNRIQKGGLITPFHRRYGNRDNLDIIMY